MLVVSPDHSHIFHEAKWSDAEVLEALYAATARPGAELVRGVGGIAEGVRKDSAYLHCPSFDPTEYAGPRRRSGFVFFDDRRLGEWRMGVIRLSSSSMMVGQSSRWGLWQDLVLDPTAERAPAARAQLLARVTRWSDRWPSRYLEATR